MELFSCPAVVLFTTNQGKYHQNDAKNNMYVRKTDINKGDSRRAVQKSKCKRPGYQTSW